MDVYGWIRVDDQNPVTCQSDHLAAFAWAVTETKDVERTTEGRLVVRTADGRQQAFEPVQKWAYEEMVELAEMGEDQPSLSFDDFFRTEIRDSPSTSRREVV